MLARLLTKQDILHLFPQPSSQVLLQFCRLWIRFVSQGVVCFLSVGFGSHDQDLQCAPCILVDHLRKGTQVLARLHTKVDISPFFLQLVSQDSTQELFRHTISSYHGVSRIEFQFCCLRTRFVSNGVFCLHSVGFGVSWTFTVIFLNDSRGSTLFVSLYVSFAEVEHDECFTLQFYHLSYSS